MRRAAPRAERLRRSRAPLHGRSVPPVGLRAGPCPREHPWVGSYKCVVSCWYSWKSHQQNTLLLCGAGRAAGVVWLDREAVCLLTGPHAHQETRLGLCWRRRLSVLPPKQVKPKGIEAAHFFMEGLSCSQQQAIGLFNRTHLLKIFE